MKTKYRLIEVQIHNDGELNEWGGRQKPYKIQQLNRWMEDGVLKADWTLVAQYDNLPAALAAYNGYVAPNVIREDEVELNIEG